jgi:hypothetical protein
VKKFVKYIAGGVVLVAGAVGLTACVSDSDQASQNLSTAAEQFEVVRRITVTHGVTGDFAGGGGPLFSGEREFFPGGCAGDYLQDRPERVRQALSPSWVTMGRQSFNSLRLLT